MLTEEHVYLPAGIDADFVMICRGASMINARIFDGDIVYIRQQDTVENGEIAAVLIDGEVTLGRVWFSDGFTVVEPANPLYRSHVFHEVPQIVGKVTAFTSVFNS